MSYSEYGSVVFSKTLAHAPGAIKRAALDKLNLYLEQKPHLKSSHATFVPFDFYLNGREKIYSGKEIFAAHITPEDKAQVEALGFSIRNYKTVPGKDAGYVSIAISKDLAGKAPEEKIDAISRLEDYFESHPDIWTGDERPVPIAEAAEIILKGPNKRYLSNPSTVRVIGGLLTREQGRDIAALGFDVFKDSDGHAFA